MYRGESYPDCPDSIQTVTTKMERFIMILDVEQRNELEKVQCRQKVRWM